MHTYIVFVQVKLSNYGTGMISECLKAHKLFVVVGEGVYIPGLHQTCQYLHSHFLTLRYCQWCYYSLTEIWLDLHCVLPAYWSVEYWILERERGREQGRKEEGGREGGREEEGGREGGR